MLRHPFVVRWGVLSVFAGMVFLPWGSAGGPTSPRAGATEPHVVVPALPDCEPKDPPPPVLKVKVRVPAISSPGKAIEYLICVENCSTAEAHHVVLKNPVPA